MADVLDVLAGVKALQAELRARVDGAMARLEAVATEAASNWIEFPRIAAYEPSPFNRISAQDMPALEKSDPLNLNLNQDQLEKYKSHVWNPTNLNSIQQKLMEYIDNGGTGISQAVQDAIFNQGRERDLQSMRDAMDLAGARTGARGCRYPTSMTKALQKEVLTNYQNQKADLSREIVRLIADLAQKNVQFAIQNDIAIEQLHSDFAVRYSALFLDTTRYIIEKFRVEQETRIAEFDGKIKVTLADVEIAKANAELSQQYKDMLVNKTQVEARELTERYRALIAEAENAATIKVETAKGIAGTLIGMLNAAQTDAITVLSRKG